MYSFTYRRVDDDSPIKNSNSLVPVGSTNYASEHGHLNRTEKDS